MTGEGFHEQKGSGRGASSSGGLALCSPGGLQDRASRTAALVVTANTLRVDLSAAALLANAAGLAECARALLAGGPARADWADGADAVLPDFPAATLIAALSCLPLVLAPAAPPTLTPGADGDPAQCSRRRHRREARVGTVDELVGGILSGAVDVVLLGFLRSSPPQGGRAIARIVAALAAVGGRLLLDGLWLEPAREDHARYLQRTVAQRWVAGEEHWRPRER